MDSAACPAPRVCLLEKHRGVIKSFNVETGYGWLHWGSGGRDIFIHLRDCTGVAPRRGCIVEFAINVLGGRTHASKAIVYEPDGDEHNTSCEPSTENNGRATRSGQERPPELKGSLSTHTLACREVCNTPQNVIGPSFKRPPPNEVFLYHLPPETRRWTGRVIYIAADRGFGFVKPEAFHWELAGLDKVYFHCYSVENYFTVIPRGTKLLFCIKKNEKGLYAVDIVPLARLVSVVPLLDARRKGSITEYDTTKLLGWVASSIESGVTIRVFFSLYQLRAKYSEKDLLRGTIIEFTVGVHARGPTAYEIDIIESAFPRTFSHSPYEIEGREKKRRDNESKKSVRRRLPKATGRFATESIPLLRPSALWAEKSVREKDDAIDPQEDSGTRWQAVKEKLKRSLQGDGGEEGESDDAISD